MKTLAICLISSFMTMLLCLPSHAGNAESIPAGPDRQVYELVVHDGKLSGKKTEPFTKKMVEKDYVNQARHIHLNMDVLTPETPLRTKDVLILDFFPECVFAVEISGIDLSDSGVLSLRAIDPDHGLETFTLSAREGKAVATFQDMARGRLYRITFEAEVGGHMVVDYDMEKMPRGRGLPPVKIPDGE